MAMNITLSADVRVIEEARMWAKAHGTSLNSMIREYLVSFTSRMEREEAARQFVENARKGAGRSDQGVSFKRGDIYKGSRFGSPEQ
jgi:hypothetical protein